MQKILKLGTINSIDVLFGINLLYSSKKTYFPVVVSAVRLGFHKGSQFNHILTAGKVRNFDSGIVKV